MKKLLLSSILLMTACSANPPVKSFTGPTGETISTIRCTQETSKCFEKASTTCNGPYRVTSSYRNSGGLIADVMPGPVMWYTMNIICGSSDGKMPEFALRGEEPKMPEFNTVTTSPQPVIQPAPRMQTTNCHMIGNNMNCTTW